MVKIKTIPEIIKEVSGRDAESEHKLVYDSPTETLEPIYFFILDLMNEFGLAPEKLLDNFVSSPGSQHFGEIGQRTSIMQQQGSKLLADINTVVRSILNIIYDLREFKIRLQDYDDLKNPSKKEGALLSLKQIWMDKVDMQKGNSGIKAMALGQAGFNTLIDAFLIVKNEQDVDNLDLNQIVKRILKPRIHEFNIWLIQSENELRKRYEIEKTYLKSQVSSLKIYSRWAKPYLKAAQDLEMEDSGRNPALVKMFNSLLLELTLLGKRKVDNSYPFAYKQKRDYFICVLINFVFRSIPQKTQQGFILGGRAEVTFSSYVLNSDDLNRLNEELDKSDISSAFNLVESSTSESLGQLEEDINYFLKEENSEEKQEKENPKDNSNPFAALFGFYNSKTPKTEKHDKKQIVITAKDRWVEKNYIIKPAIIDAKQTNYSIFDIYKKAHGMASLPSNPYNVHTFNQPGEKHE